MNSTLITIVYALAMFVAALAGGWVPLVMRLTHTRMQLALSFVAGVILGIGLLHLVPHGYEELQNIDRAVGWTMAGFLAMFFLERFFHFHRHDAPADESHNHGHAHAGGGHDHDHGHCDHQHGHHHDDIAGELDTAHAGSPSGIWSWSGVLLGLTLHGLMDGIAVAAAIQVEAGEPHGGLAGLGTFLAVVLHKPFDSLTIGTLMAAENMPRGWRHAINVIYALIAPLGILGFSIGLSQLEKINPNIMGATLCFAGGAFLCIATSDLLPEVQFHSHDRIKLSLALLLGVALAAAIVLVETSGHEHLHYQEVQKQTQIDHTSNPRSIRMRRTSATISSMT